ncbi:MAG: hypothetical protein MJA31_00720 [Clostridia bacterium]|nr:hypothetical protein [Clostridia bacterium]
MNKQYTVLKSFIFYLLIAIGTIIIIPYIIKGDIWFITCVGAIVFSIIAIAVFNHYKVVILYDKIIFYKLFKNKKEFDLSSISRISIGDIIVPNRMIGARKYLHIETKDEEYIFNINELGNTSFYNDIRELSKKYNILYEEESSKKI